MIKKEDNCSMRLDIRVKFIFKSVYATNANENNSVYKGSLILGFQSIKVDDQYLTIILGGHDYLAVLSKDLDIDFIV